MAILAVPEHGQGARGTRNEGSSGDVDENKGWGKEGARYQVSGVSAVPALEESRYITYS